MTITSEVTKRIVKKLIFAKDYRIEIVTLINAEFLNYAIDFFKKIVDAKLRNDDITIDWYKSEFINDNLSAKEIAIHSGLNKKTIHNMFNSSTKEIVIEASNEHYDLLFKSIQDLVDKESEIDLNLNIKFNNVSVDLNVNESLIIINSLAVKRAELRGGLWSTAGKKVEKPLMLTLCKLFNVSESNYSAKIKSKKLQADDFEREIDFYLINGSDHYKCEVKLMGKGNPESADAVIARNSKLFVADKLSENGKKQLNKLGIQWIELRGTNGYKKFSEALKSFDIKHSFSKKDINIQIDDILDEILS